MMSKKLECEIVQDLLPNYVENLTSEYTKERVKEHLDECLPCQSIYELMKEEVGEQVQHNVEEAKKLRWYMKKFKVVYWLVGAAIACAVYTIGIFIYEEIHINANTPVTSEVVEVTELYELENGYIYANLRVTDGYFVNSGGTSFHNDLRPGEGVVDFNRTRVPKVYESDCGGENKDNACGMIIVFNPETSHVEHISFGGKDQSFVPVNMSLIEFIENRWEEELRWNDYGAPLDVVYYEGKNKNDRIVIWERGMELPKLNK